MFKGFNDIHGFNGVPNLSFQSRGKSMIPLYGKNKAVLWLEASVGIPAGIVTNGLMTHWNDSIYRLNYSMANTTYQPRWIDSDPNFNGLPIIHFDVHNKGFVSQNLQGPAFGRGQTVAIVYQALTMNGSGSPYPLGILFGYYSTYSNSRGSTNGFCWKSGNPDVNEVGYYIGTQGTRQKTAPGITDNLVHIVVISQAGFVADGNILTPSINNIYSGGTLSALGGNNAYGPGATFKLGEIVVYNQDYDDSACLDICNELNAKYAIY